MMTSGRDRTSEAHPTIVSDSSSSRIPRPNKELHLPFPVLDGGRGLAVSEHPVQVRDEVTVSGGMRRHSDAQQSPSLSKEWALCGADLLLFPVFFATMVSVTALA